MANTLSVVVSLFRIMTVGWRALYLRIFNSWRLGSTQMRDLKLNFTQISMEKKCRSSFLPKTTRLYASVSHLGAGCKTGTSVVSADLQIMCAPTCLISRDLAPGGGNLFLWHALTSLEAHPCPDSLTAWDDRYSPSQPPAPTRRLFKEQIYFRQFTCSDGELLLSVGKNKVLSVPWSVTVTWRVCLHKKKTHRSCHSDISYSP